MRARTRGTITALAAIGLISTATVAPSAAHHKDRHGGGPPGSRGLLPGDVEVWEESAFPAGRDAGYFLRGRSGDCTFEDRDTSADDTFTCRRTTFVVAPGSAGHTLRVASDVPLDRNGPQVEVALYGPDCVPEDAACPEYLGERKSAGRRDAGAVPYTSEAIVEDVTPGAWTVLAISTSTVDDTRRGYRMRRAVVADESPGTTVEALLPNLQMEPPFDLTFTFDGLPGPSCRADELAFDGATLCLRFEFGWTNDGDGPLWIDLLEDAHVREGEPNERIQRPVGGTAYQSLLMTDGSERRRAEGVGEWHLHTAHQHYHFTNFFEGRAYRVTEQGPEAEPFVTSKVGGCSHDWKMARFDEVRQARIGSQDSGLACTGAAALPSHERIGLSAGWTDVYPSNESANMIALDDGEPPTVVGQSGTYLIVFEADPEHLVLEADEHDNVAYSLIEVTRVADGTTDADTFVARLIERGRGASPWDPDRTVLPMVPGCDSIVLCPTADLAPYEAGNEGKGKLKNRDVNEVSQKDAGRRGFTPGGVRAKLVSLLSP